VTARRALIVVSNRGPVSYRRDEDGLRVAERGAGGLATALRGLLGSQDVTWIASAMTDEDRLVAAEAGGAAVPQETADDLPYRLRLIAHDPGAYDAFYNVIANPLLWFTQHYLWGLGAEPDLGGDLEPAWEEGYRAVNRAFAAAVVEELDHLAGRAAGPGELPAAVFFHDYHLYLAPGIVRAIRPDALLGHFVHIPWPQSDYWHALPKRLREAVHDGLLANDVVGFHTERWRRNFEECASALAGARPLGDGRIAHAGRTMRTTSHAISVDVAEFDAISASEPVLEHERALATVRPELLVLRVDRTDPSKNIVRGFRAFGLLLERHPELHERVGMLALLDPSRQDVPAYAEYLAATRREAAAVNERFGCEGWLPVDLQVADDFLRSVAGYKQFDVLLVNAVYDGLNLVAKEGPLVNQRDGVLVLSENAGAHDELGEWALTVNPFDISGQADALYEALVMPAAERARRASGLRAQIRANGIEEWTRAQLADLEAVSPPPAG
jgi:trehalose 6-phosphate synthase